jgi:hypothetical protein
MPMYGSMTCSPMVALRLHQAHRSGAGRDLAGASRERWPDHLARKIGDIAPALQLCCD